MEDKRLEELEGHLLRKPALMKTQFGTHHDHRAAGIIHPFAQEILPKPALLALQHIAERFQRPLVGTANRASTPSIVEQRVHRFLQHAHFVPDDDARCLQFH